MTRVFVPRDAAALALSARTAVAAALAEHADIMRTGSRGLFWLEPMIEVETPEGRIAYGPVEAADIPGLLADGLLTATAQRAAAGRPEHIPFLARQTRLTFARCGIVDPLSLEDYRAFGGFQGLAKARAIGPAAIDRDGAGVRPARPRRRRLPDRHQVEDRRRRARATANSSSATPTRAIPAPTPTG